MTDRIPTDVWVSAHLRQFAARNISAYVTRKGAPASGTVMVKIVLRDRTCRLLSQTRDMEGEMGWMNVFEEAAVDEKRADSYIQRAAGRDPDVWVIEIENADGTNPFEGKIL